MKNLGVAYEKGHGVPRDYQTAMVWYRAAAAAGEPQAMRAIGLLYDKGSGVAKDHSQAVLWYRKAAAAGDQVSRDWLAKHPQ
jgi:TPR repeat protein